MTDMKEDQSQRLKRPNQIFSQIFLPLLLAFSVVAVTGYFLFTNLMLESADFRMWSDISVMIIFLPLIFLSLPFFMLIMLQSVLVVKIQQKVLVLGNKISPGFTHIVKAMANLANLSAKPLIALKSGFSFFKKKK
jgi:hypothetical protein